MPTFFLSHGGGPWPFMKEQMGPVFAKLERSLQLIPQQLPEKPKAVLMISGHWEEGDFAIMAHPQPPMLYDYGGFPKHTYEVIYAAMGAPRFAEQVQRLVSDAGFPISLDRNRGFDHGAFVPMAVMYPNADVPLVQLSLRKSYDPKEHFDLGRALAPLRREGILIIGSGLSYHNLRHFDRSASEPSLGFDKWLCSALLDSAPEERKQKLMRWELAPFARVAHPREDHLVPLMVAAGAAENEKALLIYHEEGIFGGVTASSFRFG